MTEPVRLAETVALAGHAGDVETVRQHLLSSHERVREVALGALERAGHLQAADLERALSDEATSVRRRAAEAAATFPGGGPPSLLAALEDAQAPVVEMAAWASGERAPARPEVTDRLAELATSHEDALCREAAVAALGSLAGQLDQGGLGEGSAGEPSGLPAVLAATRDRPAVRRRAVLALAAFNGPEVDEALERARSDRDWQVRQAASEVATPEDEGS